MSANEHKFKPPPDGMEKQAFVDKFGGVYEYSPWIAAETWDKGLTAAQDTAAGLSDAMIEIVKHADRERLMALIVAHPDLAGKAAQTGSLTAESTSEQGGAGIDQCNEEEFERFQGCNAAYKKKFGFPFVMAVKGSNRHLILAAFEERLENDADTEFQRALTEINKIARMRLEVIAAE